ncbi:hypothetical protein TcG_09948, partial [Trypanosoma cruzi]
FPVTEFCHRSSSFPSLCNAVRVCCRCFLCNAGSRKGETTVFLLPIGKRSTPFLRHHQRILLRARWLAVATPPRGTVSVIVRLSRNRDCSVVGPFGCKSGANGHVSFCRDPATLHGFCVGLRGRWEDGDITGLTAFLSVGGCTVMGIVCGRMSLRAAVFI